MISHSSSYVVKRLLEQDLADRLRTEAVDGTLQPGGRIAKGVWAANFGVAQSSIREAIVTKQSGRSTRVVYLGHKVWSEDLDARQWMVDLISEGECGIAQQSLERIAKTAHDNWEERGHPRR